MSGLVVLYKTCLLLPCIDPILHNGVWTIHKCVNITIMSFIYADHAHSCINYATKVFHARFNSGIIL